MPETLKKIKRKIQRKPEATILIGDEPFFADLKHIETQIRRYGKLLKEWCPIICPSCKTKITEKDVKRIVERRGVSSKAVLVNNKGRQNQQLLELYEKIRKKKIVSEEAFRTQERILSMYRSSSYPTEERPMKSLSFQVALKCEKCDYLLGNIDVTITAVPETPIGPDYNEWIVLEKTPFEKRIIRERLLPKGVTYEDWLIGKKTLPFIEKLEDYKKELETMPFIRGLRRPVMNIFSAINVAIEKIKDEVRLRPTKVFNLLKNPPHTPSLKIEED